MAPTPAGVFDVLQRPVTERPDHEALVCRQGRFSYAELDDLADRAAGALYELGVRPGDRVAVSWPNDADIVAAFHGAMRLGAVWVGINQVLAPPEKSYLMTDAGVSLALMATEGESPAPVVRLPVPVVNLTEWRTALGRSPGRPDLPGPDPLSPAAIAYTSGTTGFPKGAVHCQAGLIRPGAGVVARRGWGPELRKADSLPLTILNLLALTTLLTAQAGGTAILIDHSHVGTIVDWIRAERATVWNGPPAQLHTLVADHRIAAADLGSLEEVWVGGGDCPDRLRADFERRFGVRVSRTYGLTEAPALVSIDDLTGDQPDGTSGRPLDHIEVSVEAGELVLASSRNGYYRPMLEYWGHPEATAATVSGDVLRTGDLGSIDIGGHLRVHGRKSQLIIRGGANVYPAEVERVLAGAPGVQACAVVGIADERLGERVAAAIEVGPGGADEAAILAHCRSQLAAYKVPERIALVERLPRNAMGKVPKGALVELISQSSHLVGSR